MPGGAQRPLHAALRRQRREALADLVGHGSALAEFEQQAHKEAVVAAIVELLRVDDVATLRGDEAGDVGDKAGAVVARQAEGADVVHARSFASEARRSLIHPIVLPTPPNG